MNIKIYLVVIKGNYLKGYKNLTDLYFEDEIYFDHYQGDILNGARDGNGTFFFADGSFYSGIWKNNKPSGVGIFHYTDNKYDVGIYSVTIGFINRKVFWMDMEEHNTLMVIFILVTLRKEI